MFTLLTKVCPVRLKNGATDYYTVEEFDVRCLEVLSYAQCDNYEIALRFINSLDRNELREYVSKYDIDVIDDMDYDTLSESEKLAIACRRFLALKSLCR